MIETFPFVGAMSEEDYHSDAQLPTAALSHSLAHIMVSRTPAHARAACRKLNPLLVPAESDQFDRGHAAHAVLFGGGEEKLVVIDADDWRSKAAKEARDSSRSCGLYPILRKYHDDVRRMADIARDTLARCADLAGLDTTTGESEEAAIWSEGEGDERILLRIRPDWWSEKRDVILDYKTTAGSAHPNAWLRTMLTTGADLQEALYRRGNAATGGPKKALFLFLVQENYAPFAAVPIALAASFRLFAEEKVGNAIFDWRASMMNGGWPSYPRRIAYVEPPAWAITQYAEAALPQGHAYDPAVLFEGFKEGKY